MSRVKKVFAVACSSVMLAGVAASPAAAQSNQIGLVNVNVNNTCIACDVNVGAAVVAAANVCDAVKVSNIAILANQVARNGGSRTVCQSETGPVTISQA